MSSPTAIIFGHQQFKHILIPWMQSSGSTGTAIYPISSITSTKIMLRSHFIHPCFLNPTSRLFVHRSLFFQHFRVIKVFLLLEYFTIFVKWAKAYYPFTMLFFLVNLWRQKIVSAEAFHFLRLLLYQQSSIT